MSKEIHQNKHNKDRIKILLKGIIPSFIGIFLPKVQNRIIFSSSKNDFYNFNSKYLFKYMIKYYPELEVKFVINNEKKREKLNKEFGINNNYFIETKSLNGIFYALRAKAWIVSALETPVGGFLLKFNRFVYHLGHGAYFRSAVFMENYLPWKKRLYYSLIKNNFSYHLITSDTIAKIAPKMFGCKKKQIVILGEPMNDIVYEPNIEILKQEFGESIVNDKNIIYMPTWRQDGSLRLFPFDDMEMNDFVDFLENEKINFFLRMHPLFEEDLSTYERVSKRFKVMDASKVEDVNEVVGFFDLLITDYSSGFVGYMLTEKPLMFLPYDLKKYEKRMGFVMPYNNATPGPKPTTYVDFKDEIRKLLYSNEYYLDKRKRVNKLFNKYKNDSCKMNSEFVLRKLK